MRSRALGRGVKSSPGAGGAKSVQRTDESDVQSVRAHPSCFSYGPICAPSDTPCEKSAVPARGTRRVRLVRGEGRGVST